MENYRNRYDGIDDYAAKMIRYKARQLVGTAGLTEADRPDLEQELMIDLLQRIDRYNPAKAKKTTFMTRIIENHICTILEARHARCRDWRMCRTSLNDKVGNCEGSVAERIDMVNSEGVFGCHEEEPKAVRLEELRLDLKQVIDSLPPDQQDLCERLCHSNIREIARETCVHRSTLYDKLYKIQEAFMEAGIKK